MEQRTEGQTSLYCFYNLGRHSVITTFSPLLGRNGNAPSPFRRFATLTPYQQNQSYQMDAISGKDQQEVTEIAIAGPSLNLGGPLVC